MVIRILKRVHHLVKSQIRFFKYPYWVIVRVLYKLNVLKICEIPIIINNFNRLTYLITLVSFLDKCGCKNIVILDNNSTYPPLLDYYEVCKFKVIRLDKNYGYLSFWKTGIYKQYKWNYFVYTDSDVVPISDCPANFLEYLKSLLDKHLHLDKVGLGIKIDDLPDSFVLKDKVIEYEKNYWKYEVKPNIYRARVDTTFALYKPLSNLKHGYVSTLSAYRTGFPYMIQHLPWYVDSSRLTDEESYYLQTSDSSSSIALQLKGEGIVY